MKKAIAYIMVVIVLSFIGILGFAMYNKMLEAEVVRERIAKLPYETITAVSQNLADSLLSRPVIINYFNTECRFCQAEIRSMQEHVELQTEAKLILVSDEPPNILDSFINRFEIDTTILHVEWDSDGLIREYFGVRAVPATFVYGTDSLLVNSFKGETKAELLYELIQ